MIENSSRIDFLIVSALSIEHKAILKQLHIANETHEDRLTHLRLFQGRETPRGIALPLLEIGRIGAAVTVTKALANWDPKIVLLVGMAGGFESKNVKLGDVIVATEILDFELQKLTYEGKEIRWRTYKISPNLLDVARITARQKWSNNYLSAKVHFAPILSGEKIIASNLAARDLQGLRSDAIGVEMEGAGVALAAQETETDFLMIRGVSDFANERKSDFFQKDACRSAADFSIALLKNVYHNNKEITY